MHIFTKFDDLQKISNKQFTHAAVVASFVNDVETPVSIYAKLTNFKPYSFLLESANNEGVFSRYSFIGMNPKKILEFKDHVLSVKEGKSIRFQDFKDPLCALEKELNNFIIQPDVFEDIEMPLLRGGAVGFFGYENSQYFEKIPLNKNNTLNLPDSVFGIYDDLVIFDHFKSKVIFVKYLDLNAVDLKGEYDKIVSIFEIYKSVILDQSNVLSELQFPRDLPLEKEFESNETKQSFCEKVEKALDKVRSGDVYQIQISQRLSMQLKESDNSFDVYRRLRIINPSPYMFYLKYPDFDIVGASPETSLRVEGRNVLIRPIAGTRKRTGDIEKDLIMEEELLNCTKEQAEHMMLVDLARNDIGRVCDLSEVKVEHLMHLERFSHVVHMVSDIRGVLRKDRTVFDAFRSTFPHGTVTGAPKIRAQQIIAEMEEDRRGIYSGSVGYFDFFGNTDSAIAIRTILVKNNVAYMQAAGGIVYDSIPEMEYKESMNKMAGCLAAIL